ncbi:hypothetical protein BGZ73_004703 [Actinomortierella ambigua]|nr:hypothetical protein BGZ73_004703 [Actinomortierella ambigua]
MYNPTKIALLLLSTALATVSVDAQSSSAPPPSNIPPPTPLQPFFANMTAMSAAVALAGVPQAGCPNSPLSGGNCPEASPCCSIAGYCGADPLFCGETCQPGGSFDATDSCWPLPMAVNFHDEFKDPARLVHSKDFNGFPDSADWVVDFSAAKNPHAEITADQKLVLRLNRFEPHPETGGGIGATVHSTRWLHYGTIEARLKTASNLPGTVTSFILISSKSGDEIDFEIVGKDSSNMQTNFYYRVRPGRPVNYAHGKFIDVALDTSADYHDYKLEWTPTEMKWYFDGELKRTTTVAEAKGEYPDTPMRVAFGLWDGGSSPNEGTADWAGKNTSYGPNNDREYLMSIDWVKITPMNPDTSTEPWPGSKYLKRMEDNTKKPDDAKDGDANGGGSGGRGSGSGGNGGGKNIPSSAMTLTPASSLVAAILTTSLAAIATLVLS